MIFKNRGFYDLCRKYKYYYKAYQEIDKINENIYWSKYLRSAADEVKEKLEEVENEMCMLLLEEIGFFPDFGLTIDNNIEPVYDSSMFEYVGIRHIGEKKITIESDKLAENIARIVEKYVQKKGLYDKNSENGG